MHRLLNIVYAGVLSLSLLLWAHGCSDGSAFLGGSDTSKHNSLDIMKQATITISQQPFQVWLAMTPDEQELGLMNVTADELAPLVPPLAPLSTLPTPASQSSSPAGPITQRGMLFVFSNERSLGFWMANTITALDIAYIAADGRIVRTYTMAPLETRTYPSIEPAQFALEVRAGLFAELGIAAGQYVDIPESVLKSQF